MLADFSAMAPGQRNTAVQAAIVRYAELLERYCRRAPYNWFNFYDYWHDEAQKPTVADHANTPHPTELTQ